MTMPRKMPNRETNPGNPQNQSERRRQERRRERQPEGWPSDERRKDQRRENIQMAQGQQESAHEKGEGTAGYSNPPSGKEFGPGGRERSFGPQNPQKRQERESGNFGVSYDRGFGQNPGDQGAGGKTDSGQRDMGETGQRK
jgi:hypothetical protein